VVIAAVVSATGSVSGVRPYGGRRCGTEGEHVAKSKGDLLAQAQAQGVVAGDADGDAYTVEQLQGLLRGDEVVRDRVSASEPIVAADGHVVLSREDIRARDS
jgi:hypothetical protein